LFKALSTGGPINPEWLTPQWPPYWHYDILQALVVLCRLGLAADPRTADAKAMLRAGQSPDGRWRAGDRWWKAPGRGSRAVEAVDWHADDAGDRMVTLRALTVLRS
jgi:hypothetical protein